MAWVRLFIAALVAGLAGAGSVAAAGDCGGARAVAFAGVNWESGAFITAVLRQILERGYGCRTLEVPGNSVTLEQATANDDVQIFAEEWVSRSDVWKRAAAAGSVRAVGHPFTGAREGWFVPDYLTHRQPGALAAPRADGLRSVAQLTDPRFVALFRDPEQPGRGRFLNCPSGWTCEGVNTAKLHAYGLDNRYVDFRPGTGTAMDASILADYLQRRPLLFYYWSPSAIAGKLKLTQLIEPPYTPACYADLTSAYGRHDQGCGAPEADVAYGVSHRFADAAPRIMALLARARFPLEALDANLVAMVDAKRDPAGQALAFLRKSPNVWREWVDAATFARIQTSLARRDVVVASSDFPTRLTLSIRGPVNAAVAALVTRHGAAFRSASNAMLAVVVAIDSALAALPWWSVILLLMTLTWLGARRLSTTLAVGALMIVVGALGLWALTLETLTLVLVASGVALAVGLPLGVAAAKSRGMRALVMPTLDVMQTMPSFVYLIPALMLFGLGKVPAILATIVYALPPMIRLTLLGLDTVDAEIKEAATAFGTSPLQLLFAVELPLARPSLMAGVNQTIMLALSMVVVASMIGARGLGEQVLNGIQTLDVGQGLEAGVGIVILAVVLDRITQGFGRRGAQARLGER